MTENRWLLCVFAFLLGAVPVGYLAGRFKGIDIREHGSGNIGATNVLRLLGWQWGVPVLLLDVLKGYVPVLLARNAGFTPPWLMATGLAAILGHTYSPFLRFRGGKGIATSLGVLTGLSPVVAGGALAVFAVVVFLSRYVSLGSVVAAFAQAALFFALPHPPPYRVLGVLALVFVVVKHRANIARLRAGTENRLGKKTAGSGPAQV